MRNKRRLPLVERQVSILLFTGLQFDAELIEVRGFYPLVSILLFTGLQFDVRLGDQTKRDFPVSILLFTGLQFDVEHHPNDNYTILTGFNPTFYRITIRCLPLPGGSCVVLYRVSILLFTGLQFDGQRACRLFPAAVVFQSYFLQDYNSM